MLNTNVGVIEGAGETASILTHAGVQGHAVYGPYETLQPGLYRIAFKFDPGTRDSIRSQIGEDVFAVVDVVSDQGNYVVSVAELYASKLDDNDEYILDFQLLEARNLEYRLYVNGRATFKVYDSVAAQSVAEDGYNPPAILKTLSEGQKNHLRGLYFRGVKVDFEGDNVVIPRSELNTFIQTLSFLQSDLVSAAKTAVNTVGYRGGEANDLYKAIAGTDRARLNFPQPMGLTSSLCQQAHFLTDQYRFWSRAIKEKPIFYRKNWEFFYIAQALHERGYLKPGKKGLVFGAGTEPLPSLFASFGAEILASDQAPEAAEASGWTATGQHTYDLMALNERKICTDRMFRELVSYRSVDMNDIPKDLGEQFDFCWSACAFEHLGSLQHGLDFVENSIDTLKPGGVAIHTTEFNLTSNEDTLESEFVSIYRRRDIEEFIHKMERKGYIVDPMDWEIGQGFAELVVDMPPYGRGEPHIRLQAAGYDCTSIGLIITKPL